MLNKTDESRHPCCAAGLREEVFTHSPLSMMLSVGCSWILIALRSLPFIPWFVEWCACAHAYVLTRLYQEWMLDMVKCFLCFFFSLILKKEVLRTEIPNITRVDRTVIRSPHVSIIQLGRNANSQTVKKSYRTGTLGRVRRLGEDHYIAMITPNIINCNSRLSSSICSVFQLSVVSFLSF